MLLHKSLLNNLRALDPGKRNEKNDKHLELLKVINSHGKAPVALEGLMF